MPAMVPDVHQLLSQTCKAMHWCTIMVWGVVILTCCMAYAGMLHLHRSIVASGKPTVMHIEAFS